MVCGNTETAIMMTKGKPSSLRGLSKESPMKSKLPYCENWPTSDGFFWRSLITIHFYEQFASISGTIEADVGADRSASIALLQELAAAAIAAAAVEEEAEAARSNSVEAAAAAAAADEVLLFLAGRPRARRSHSSSTASMISTRPTRSSKRW